MHRSYSFIGFALSLVLVLVGCDETPDPPPAPDPDQARECYPPGVDAGSFDGGTPGCRAGELCLDGRCYAGCTDDDQCGPGEACASSGVCVRATGDAGVEEPEACDVIRCSAPSVCHPRLERCTDCNAPGPCGDDTICDVVNGECVSPTPSQCAPCHVDDDCTSGDDIVGRCVHRTVMGVEERVCMMACEDEACPAGLRCGDDGFCAPIAEMSCTNWLRGTSEFACFEDRDCGPAGGAADAFPGVCDDVMPSTEDGGVALAGKCLLPCEESSVDCPGVRNCALGSMGEGPFCRLPTIIGPEPSDPIPGG